MFISLLLVRPVLAADTLLVIGDSLSAAYGMPAEQGWVQLMQQRLDQQYPGWTVVNASITGDTTRGGLGRLPGALQRHQPDIVVIELGGNDGLRGFGLQRTEDNLRQMIQLARAEGAQVLLLGIKLPANYGKHYGEKFHAIFSRLSRSEQVPLLDFLLQGIALNPAMMQADGIHPAANAQPRMLENVWLKLQPMIQAR